MRQFGLLIQPLNFFLGKIHGFLNLFRPVYQSMCTRTICCDRELTFAATSELGRALKISEGMDIFPGYAFVLHE
jgi:hypothetical protein